MGSNSGIKLTYDTPVLIKIIDGVGTYIPELKTYVPLESYASVAEIIQIMNRGIYVEFPKQSKELEISKAIESLMIEYMETLKIARSKKGDNVGTDINNAIDVVQDMNNTKKSVDQLNVEENETSIFKSDSESRHVMEVLLNNDPVNIFESDDYIDPDKRIERYERERKVRKLIEEDKSYMSTVMKSEAQAYKNITKLSNGDENNHYDDFMDLDLDGAKD